MRVYISIFFMLGILGFTATLFHALHAAPVEEEVFTYAYASPLVPNEEASAPPISSRGPVRLSIPSIGVEARVEHVGIGKSGNMAVPTSYDNVAWYRNGPAPGESGKAVFAGHLDNALGVGEVFERLGELSSGDDVYVADSSGQTLHFAVASKGTVESSASTEEIFTRTGPSQIVLITCEGLWDQSKKQYSDRLIIVADLVG